MKRTTKCCVFLQFILLALAFRVAYADIREELVGHWTFDEGEGTTATDDVRVYGQVLSEDEALELLNWAGGADAGPDQAVFAGERVTLTGSGPDDATSFTWMQIAGQDRFTATLEPSANQAIVEFDTPSVDIGFLLTFELTVVSPSEGTATDAVHVKVLAPNPPKLAPSNIHVLPLDLGAQGLGFRTIWDPLIDADRYDVALQVNLLILWIEEVAVPMYDVKGLTEGQPRTIGIRGRNKFGAPDNTAAVALVSYTARRNLASRVVLPGVPVYIDYVCVNGQCGGINDGKYDDNNDSWNGLYKTEDYWGYLWRSPMFFDHIAYYTGKMFVDGGWFLDLKVQYTQDGTRWVDAPIREIYPEYDFSDQREGKRPFTRYDISIPTLRGTGIRIYGTPGGSATFTSVAELEVFGNQTQGPLVVQGIDAECPERGTALLDGRLTFSVLGPITSYQWTGPASITIANPTSAIASFTAPRVTADTLYVFSLQASDGTNTGTDNDVRILVKNLPSTADAGPDLWVYGGETVTLTGSGPADATSFHWDQVGGTPTVTLQPSPDQATVEFTAPALEIGTILTFRLTVDAPSTQGQTTDEVQVMVRAVNPPKWPLTNIHVLPLDLGTEGLGCRIIWDPVLDAEFYEVGLEFDGTIVWLEMIDETSYEVKGMVEGQVRIITIRARNKFGVSTLIARIAYTAMPNLARPTALGGKYPPLEPIPWKTQIGIPPFPYGPNDGRYNDSNDSWNGLCKAKDYWGYLWNQPLFFDHVVYFTGEMFADGGWFLDLKVQYTQDGTTWLDAPIREIYPEYDFTDQREGKQPFTRYDISIPTLRGTGIRIYGTPGGTATFTSIAELEVFGLQIRDPLIVQGSDGEYPEGPIAFLDGSFTFSTRGPITSYQWTGPGEITIANPTSAIASFRAPYVTADTLYVFELQASDGTNTDTDSDVRILVKNIVTTADAGPDQSVVEGTEVTLDGCDSLTTTGTTTYLWTQTSGTDVGVTGSTSCIVTFIAPTIWAYEEKLTFRLDVEDGDGDTSSDEVVVTVRNALAWPAYPVTYAATIPYLQNLLHLGTNPTDRLVNPHSWGNITSGFDPLESFGGVRSIRPYPGLEFDFTGTGVQVSRNPMVWTPVFSNTGIFGNTGLDEFQMHYNVYILSPEYRDVRWHVRNEDEVRVFCNGAIVLRRDAWDTNVDQVEYGLVADGNGLKKGLNVVTGWYEEAGGGAWFAVGITDPSDVPFPDLLYSLGPSLILTDVYASRSLPDSFEPGEKVRVDLAIKVNPNNPPSSVTITESISGIPHWTPPDVWIQAPGATIVPPDRLWWVLTGPNVKNQTLSYWLTVPAETTQALRFCGTLTFGTTVADIYGENVIYPLPTVPRFVTVEMLQAAHLSWSAPVTEGTASYNIYRSVNGGPYELIGSTESTSYTDKWVLPGDTYAYEVSAVNQANDEGPLSRPTAQVSIPTMEIRQAEDFNYDSGLFPWTAAVTLPPIEAPDADTIGTPAEYDFYHPGVECGPPAPPWPPEYRPDVCIIIVEEADNPGVFATVISGIVPGSWYRYSFNVPQAGWVKFEFRVAAPSGGMLAAFWDETLVGTVSYNTADWNIFTWALMEDQIQTTAGVHTLRVKSVSGQLNFDTIAILWNAAPPTRLTIWEDNFDNYTSTADVFSPTVGKWSRGTTTNSAGSWTLWPTEGPPLGTEPANIAWMENKYMISDSELSGEGVLLDEEMISPEVGDRFWTKLRLNFNKNYRIYDDVDHTQDAEVDIRSFDPLSGWSNWTNLLHLDTSDVDPTADPPELSDPEVFDLSAYDRKKIQLRFHFFNAEYDYWFAFDKVRVSGVQAPPEIPRPDITVEDGYVRVSWTSFGPGQYSVEYTTDPGGGWTKIAGPFTHTSFYLPIPADKRGYYRIVGQ